MKISNILAHRGWWRTQEEKNSRAAFVRALEAGFGIETDFRDLDGTLVISHDPPRYSDEPMTAEEFFALYAASAGRAGRIAVNIKADNVLAALTAAVSKVGGTTDDLFAFDMSVPDGLAYLRASFPVYSRLSEYEDAPAYGRASAGVWIDNFSGEFAQVARAAECLEAGYRVCLVSSELHGRDHAALWKEIVGSGLHQHPNFELCTDLPDRARDILAIG